MLKSNTSESQSTNGYLLQFLRRTQTQPLKQALLYMEWVFKRDTNPNYVELWRISLNQELPNRSSDGRLVSGEPFLFSLFRQLYPFKWFLLYLLKGFFSSILDLTSDKNFLSVVYSLILWLDSITIKWLVDYDMKKIVNTFVLTKLKTKLKTKLLDSVKPKMSAISADLSGKSSQLIQMTNQLTNQLTPCLQSYAKALRIWRDESSWGQSSDY